MKPPPFPACARLGGAGNAGCNPDGNPSAIESRPWLAALVGGKTSRSGWGGPGGLRETTPTLE
jgi:hypothetical protein